MEFWWWWGGYSGGQGPAMTNRQGGGGGGSYDIKGSSNNATQYTSWNINLFGNIPSTYSSGYCTGNGFCIFSLLSYFTGTSWFNTQIENYIGITSDFSNINASSGGIIPAYNNTGIWNTFSIELFGYFYAPTTETYTFSATTDDFSYLWIGSNALAGYTTSNYTVTSTGNTQQSGTIGLTAGTYYPIRIQYGNSGGGYELIIGFSTPTISYTTNLIEYVYYGLGRNISFSANSARLIRAITNVNTDASYYININGTSINTYCIMNSTLYARYQASNYSISENKWYDSSSSIVPNHLLPFQINSSGLSIVNNNAANGGGNFTVLTGTTNTIIKLTTSELKPYTLFTVARYTSSGGARIFTGNYNNGANPNWLSGFHNGNTREAYHEGWLTSSSQGYTSKWIVSSDTKGIYRANGQSFVINTNTYESMPAMGINVMINNGNNEQSNFQVADILIYNSTLSLSDIITIENYLMTLYGITPGAF